MIPVSFLNKGIEQLCRIEFVQFVVARCLVMGVVIWWTIKIGVSFHQFIHKFEGFIDC